MDGGIFDWIEQTHCKPLMSRIWIDRNNRNEKEKEREKTRLAGGTGKPMGARATGGK